jgi:hypothetical protein
MSILDVLIKAKALIKDQSHWTLNAFARNAKGGRTDSSDKNAICFCAMGACYRVSDPIVAEKTITELNKSAMALFSATIEAVNDSLGHAAVIRVFNHAIASKTLETADTSDENLS